MTIGTFAALAAALVVLTACGGGGGSGGPGPSSGTLNPSTWVLGDAILWTGGQSDRAATSCPGGVCTIKFQGESRTIDLAGIEPDGGIPDIGPVTSRNGVETATFSLRDDGISIDSYGAWGEYNLGSPFAARLSASGVSVSAVIPASIGHRTGTNPVSGSATWRGAMVGNAYSGSELGPPVIGDTTLTVNFQASSVDVDITGIAERQSGHAHADMRWRGLRMSGGAFSAGGIDGRFYGPGHEEAGGVIDRNGIAGAFSAKRQ